MTHFSDYLNYCQHLITTRRIDYLTANPHDQQKILAANLPFGYAPTTTNQAVILIHGLYDSPCIMQSLSSIFLSENYLVRSLLLPGHGTRPEDLFTTTYEEWLSACRLAINLLPNSIERIILAGFSTGALLSHYLALNKAIPRLAGLVAIAPALQLHPIEGNLLKHATIVNLARQLSPWSFQSPVYDYAKYSQHALNGAHQVQRLIDQCPEQDCELPVFWVLSTSDKVIDSATIWPMFQRKQKNAQSRCLIYSPTALAFDDPRFIVRSSCYPEQSISNFSHICLSVAPDHVHYGSKGDYTLSLQPLDNQPRILGERGGKTTVRLTYNPDFDYMAQAIREFLRGI